MGAWRNKVERCFRSIKANSQRLIKVAGMGVRKVQFKNHHGYVIMYAVLFLIVAVEEGW